MNATVNLSEVYSKLRDAQQRLVGHDVTAGSLAVKWWVDRETTLNETLKGEIVTVVTFWTNHLLSLEKESSTKRRGWIKSFHFVTQMLNNPSFTVKQMCNVSLVKLGAANYF